MLIILATLGLASVIIETAVLSRLLYLNGRDYGKPGFILSAVFPFAAFLCLCVTMMLSWNWATTGMQPYSGNISIWMVLLEWLLAYTLAFFLFYERRYYVWRKQWRNRNRQ